MDFMSEQAPINNSDSGNPVLAERPYLDAASQKALCDRLARLEGHLRSLRHMVREHRCADEILLQTAAVKAALNSFSAVLLDHELRACMNSCMEGNADERLEKVVKVLSTLLKQS
jgi:CsoR family transcriptional regulator, copper-sensing transcriptional repressor